MAKYINAEHLSAKIWAEILVKTKFVDVLKEIDNIPPADVRENVRGEWVSHKLENEDMSIDKDTCSVCGVTFTEIARTGGENYNFCPHCGASMGGDA